MKRATYKYVTKLCRAMQDRNTRVQHSSQKLYRGRFPHVLLPVPGEKNANIPISYLFPHDPPLLPRSQCWFASKCHGLREVCVFFAPATPPRTEGNIEIGVDGVSGGRPMQDARVCVFFARGGLQHHTLRFLLKRLAVSSV